MENIHLRMYMSEMAFQHDDIIDDIEYAIRRYPDCCDQLVPHVIRLMNSPVESIRNYAYGFALDIIGQRPQLKEAYIKKMQSSDLDVARQAFTFLPDFVNVCIDSADELIGLAMKCNTSKNVLNDVNECIVYAMKVFGQLNDEDSQNADLKKETKKRLREDGEIS